MRTQAIVVAAGRGRRLKSALPKALVPLLGKPLVVYSLEVFQKSPLIESVVLVASKGHLAHFRKIVSRYRLSKVEKIIEGGKHRRDSVSSGLSGLSKDTDTVLIHDAARPFVTARLIAQCLKNVQTKKAVVAALPVKPTIKMVNARTLAVEKTLERQRLWEIQTPQVFNRKVICEAHRRIKDENPSDDALLVEKSGRKVFIVPGDDQNIKITTREDLAFAKAILFARKK